MAGCRGEEEVEAMLSGPELAEALAGLGLPAPGLATVEAAVAAGGEEQAAGEWLAWARGHPDTVRVVDARVPEGVLPSGTVASLADVRVGDRGRGRRPDDALYNGSADLRDRIARGNTVLRLEDARTGAVTLDLVIFALKKFTGGLGDEDEAQPEDGQVWQRYFLRPMEEVDRVVCVTKENGEAAHLAVRFIQGQFYYVCGSKNVHLMFRNREQVEQYTESRYSVARTVALAWLRLAGSLEPASLRLLCSLLAASKLTVVFEVLCPDYQHVVSLSHLAGPELRLLTLTEQWVPGAGSLTALPPDTCLQLGRALGIPTAEYAIVPAAGAEARMEAVRAGRGYEGEVLYFIDSQEQTVGLVKKKTAWYVLCRAIREKAHNLTAEYRKAGGLSAEKEADHLARMDRRVGQIQAWLGLSPARALHWCRLGRGYLHASLAQLRAEPGRLEELCERGRFPQQWAAFLQAAGEQDTEEEGPRGEEGPRVEEEPACSLREGGPAVQVEAAVEEVRPHLAACAVRGLKLGGGGLARLRAVLHKAEGRRQKAGNPGLPWVGLHDLARVEASLVYTLGPGGPVLRQGEAVISRPPLATCEETELTEATEDLFVEATCSTSQRAAEDALSGLLRQIYHLRLGGPGGGPGWARKAIAIEQSAVTGPAGVRLCPAVWSPDLATARKQK